MRDYIPQKQDKYWLPANVYRQAKYAVRDYDRLKAEYNELLLPSVTGEGGGHGSTPGNPTENSAMRRAQLSDRLTAIDRAVAQIPEEYRRGLLDNIMYGAACPYSAGIATWSRQRRKLLYFVAKYLNIL